MMRRAVSVIILVLFALSQLSCESDFKVDEKMQLLEGKYVMSLWIDSRYSDDNLVSKIPDLAKQAEVVRSGNNWYFHFVMTGIDEHVEYTYRDMVVGMCWDQVLCRYCFSRFSDSEFDIQMANDNVGLREENGTFVFSYNDFETIIWERDI